MKKTTSIITIAMLPLLVSCGGDGTPRIKDATEVTIYEPTKGTVTEVKEVDPGNKYKILDERLIEKKEDSYAIVHNLNGSTDTLSLRTIEKDHSSGTRSYSPLRGLLFYSLASSYFNNRVPSSSGARSYYADDKAFQKSQGLQNEMKSSARTRRVKSPGMRSRGYGSGKSFRSYGG
ncbi:hypothetical protein ACOSP6_06365 [Tenacibaculum sp. MEBiC06402]|uniref:hypothetical protein n=1 Tax=unclassified Tenacibaculum TaxID=2635139 RepID=UPI003B9D35C7